ncbi:GtrA family protein [Streptomyces sp. NPDC050508]|uniref:GtrA family protein n=1 Tax=Streptomyces sp. NPDC050508 TaxID=3155405 RepID=UPI00343C8734
METAMDDAPRTPAAPGPLASFARFVALGGGVGLLSSGAVALLAEQLPWAVANALITVASTLLCTELHARFTFGSGRPAGWRGHWQSAGSAAAAYAVTCAAMFVLHLVQSSPGMLTEQIVYLGASGLAGLARFLLLRLYVFATGRDRTKDTIETVSSPVPVPVLIPVPVRTTAPRPARALNRHGGFPLPARAATAASESWKPGHPSLVSVRSAAPAVAGAL